MKNIKSTEQGNISFLPYFTNYVNFAEANVEGKIDPSD